MDGKAGLGGRQQLQPHVELGRAEVSQMLGSTHLSHLRGRKKNKGRIHVVIMFSEHILEAQFSSRTTSN